MPAKNTLASWLGSAPADLGRPQSTPTNLRGQRFIRSNGIGGTQTDCAARVDGPVRSFFGTAAREATKKHLERHCPKTIPARCERRLRATQNDPLVSVTP